MKNLLYLFVALAIATGVASCSKEEEGHQKWEYKTLVVYGENVEDFFLSRTFVLPLARLESLGQEGWELVNVYTQIETVYPNFGNERYVTGLQSNTRTSEIYYILKRPVLAGDTVKTSPYEFISSSTNNQGPEVVAEAEPIEEARED